MRWVVCPFLSWGDEELPKCSVLCRHISFYCGSLHHASQTLHCTHVEVCGNRVLSKCMGGIFLKAFAHFVSRSHFGNSHNISDSFCYYICYCDLWSVSSDTILVIALGCHKPHSYEMVNLMDKCCMCSDCSPSGPWRGFSIAWNSTILKLGHLITLQ